MAKDSYIISVPIIVGSRSSAPSSPENGMSYYDTTLNQYRVYENGSWRDSAMSDAEIKTAYENNADTNEFSDAEQSKLAAIEASATADQTGAEIKTAYEGEADTNAFTDADESKLDGIEASATADQTNAEIKTAYEANSDTNEFSDAEQTKLSAIEASADVTDATNVDAAGAVMNSDSSTASMTFVVDEDNMASDLATKVPTQQSVKKYVDDKVVGLYDHKGGYNASTNTPDLDTSPSGVLKGDAYTVDAAGTFFTESLEIGDVIIADQDDPTLLSHWTRVNKNLDAAGIKVSYESNADTNEFSDAEQSKLAGIEASATADQSDAEIKTAYENNSDTNAFTDADESKLDGIAANAIANLSEDTTPSLGGDLTLGANVVVHDGDGMKRGSSGTDFLEEEYMHSISLLASQTNTVMSSFTFAHASFEGCLIEYKMKEATSNDVRVGRLLVATEGTNTSIVDSFTETADTGITWSAAVNGANVEIKYSSGSNVCTMRADVKRFKT